MTTQPRRTVTVFGSARPQPGQEAYEQARALGKELAAAGWIVCNGGYGGTMEATARGAWDAGLADRPRTIGVTCSAFGPRRANTWIDQEEVTATLLERLARLLERGDAYVVLPGGTGTLLELAAAAEFISKRLLAPRPVVLLGSHWDAVLAAVSGESGNDQSGSGTLTVFHALSPAECAAVLYPYHHGGSDGHDHSSALP